MARYKRMRGLDVFYPMGWDDNGLPTERRVQNYFNVRCDPSLSYDSAFDRYAFEPHIGPKPLPVPRMNFIDLCQRLTAEDEQAFEDLFRLLGLSVDWTRTYTTIGEVSRRMSQRGFLRLAAEGYAYTAEAPTMWDVDFRTAVAQAEIEDREQEGHYHRVAFDREEGGTVQIETSRPELIPACVALVAHPSDVRYADLVGSNVITPLFGVPVPVVAHELADPEKGTGIAMICTFGDLTDVTWWKELGLPTRVVVGRDGTLIEGRFGEQGWESRDAVAANEAMGELTGKGSKQARRRIAELLRDAGALVGEPQAVRHVVKYYEKGDRPLEVITSRQWFVRTLSFKEELLARGREISWHPGFMGARYASWVEGSEQRLGGEPAAVLRRAVPCVVSPRRSGRTRLRRTRSYADEAALPVDPQDESQPASRSRCEESRAGSSVTRT